MKSKKFKKIEIETFREVGSYDIYSLTVDKPSAFNSEVHVKKYKITVEEMDEDFEIMSERIKKLWRETDNYHQYESIKKVAKSYGVDLSNEKFGSEAQK